MGLFDIIDEIAEKQVTKTETGDNRIFGVLIGQVVSNYDASMPGRICVSITTRDKDANELKWARVAMPSSGKDWGHYFLPEVGDEVLVVFEQGNIEKPYIIGCIPKDSSTFHKKAVDEHNKFKKITTKHGSTITFEDAPDGDGTKDKITVETATGAHKVQIDNEKNLILITDKDGKNKIEMKTGDDAGQINIVADKKLTIRVGENIKVDMNGSNGTTKLTTGKLITESSAKTSLQASGPFTIEGSSVGVSSNAMMKFDSSGAVQIKGTPINIG